MSKTKFDCQLRRCKASAPAKFAIGVVFAVGATLVVDQSAFSRSSKPERLSKLRNAGGEKIELAELSKRSTASGVMDLDAADGVRTRQTPLRRRQDLQFVREEGGELAPREVAGTSGQPSPLPIKLTAIRLSEGALLTFKGLPDSVKLSAGFRFQGSWAVALKDASALMLLPNQDYEGVFTMEVSLMKKQETAEPEKQTIRVAIRGQRADRARTVSIGSGQNNVAEGAPPPSVGPASATLPKIPATEEAAMMERASNLLQSGDVAAARLIYERLARRGSSQGALALARTFDPESLRSLGVVGLKADIGKAKEWYKKAAELGSKEAVNRLAALETAPR